MVKLWLIGVFAGALAIMAAGGVAYLKYRHDDTEKTKVSEPKVSEPKVEVSLML